MLAVPRFAPMSGMRTVALAIAGCLLASHAYAAPFISTVGLPNASVTITFDEVPLARDTLVHLQFEELGVTFNPVNFGMIYSPLPLGTEYPGISGNHLGNFPSNLAPPLGIIDVRFNEPQTEMALGLATFGGLTLFRALLGGQVVESFSALSGNFFGSGATPFGFYGFTDILFDQILVRPEYCRGCGLDFEVGYGVIDNLQFSSRITPVPEPSSVLLLGAGVVALVVSRRSRRHRDETT